MEDENKKSEELKTLIREVNKSDISSFRKMVMLLIAVINNPRSNAKELKVVIEKDPSLSARVLRLANSAYYNSGRKIGNIKDAIVRIGFNTVKELAFSQKVSELFQKDESNSGFSRAELWEHCIAVATFCRFIYQRELRKSGENIYTAGLIHDLGIIIEDQFMQEKFMEVLKKSNDEKCSLSEAENSVIGFDHSKIGGALISDWNFPQESIAAVTYHHEPSKADNEFREIVSVLYVSEYICKMNEMGYCDDFYENKTEYENTLKFLAITEESMDTAIEEVRQLIQKMKDGGWFS